MKKRILLTILVITLLVPQIALSTVQAAETTGAVATPTASKVLVNGESISFDAYLINGNNYFKLRDLAYALSGTEKQFDVGWDGANNAISLTSGIAYTSVGGEMTGKGQGNKTVVPMSSTIYLDGSEILLVGYNIDGNNYFKLRDVAVLFDFEVDWSESENTVIVSSKGSYYSQKWALETGGILYEYERVEYFAREMQSYFTYTLKTADGKTKELPYEYMTKLSNGYFRAVYNIRYREWGLYRDGNMVYLDRQLDRINDSVYARAFDFIEGFAAADKLSSTLTYSEEDFSAGYWRFDEDLGLYYYYDWIPTIVYEDGSERELSGSFEIRQADDYVIMDIGGDTILLDADGNEKFKLNVEPYSREIAYLGSGYFLFDDRDDDYNRQLGVKDYNGNIIISPNKEYRYIGVYSNGAFPVSRDQRLYGSGISDSYGEETHYPPDVTYRSFPNVGKPGYGYSDYVWIDLNGNVLRELTADEISKLEDYENPEPLIFVK